MSDDMMEISLDDCGSVDLETLGSDVASIIPASSARTLDPRHQASDASLSR
jgi:hypothetical protein